MLQHWVLGVLRRERWRIALLLLAMVITFCGVRWWRLSQRKMYVGDFHPAGHLMIAYEYDELTSVRMNKVKLRHTDTGEEVVDLSHYRWKSGSTLRWSADGQQLVGLADDPEGRARRLLVIEPLPVPRIIRQWSVPSRPQVLDVLFDADGRVIHVQVTESSNALRPYLEIIADNDALLAKIEYGRHEFAAVYANRDGRTINVRFDPDTTVGPQGDFVFSDGKQHAFCQFDPATGDRIRLLHGRYDCLFPVSDFICKYGAQGHQVFRSDDLQTPVMTIAASERPLATALKSRLLGSQLAGRGAQGSVTVYDLESGRQRTLSLPPVEMLLPSADGHAMMFTHDGQLVHLNLDTGEQQRIINVRQGLPLYRAIAVVGIPVLCWWWIRWASQRQTLPPYVEMILLGLTVSVIGMFWSASGLGIFQPQHPTTVFAVTVFNATLMFLLIWAFSAQSFWAVTLPIVLLQAAASLAVMLLWSQGTAPRLIVMETLLGGGSAVAWHLLGWLGFRRCFGTLKRADDVALAVAADQITLWQVLVATAALASFFAMLQFVDFRQVDVLAEASFLIWLTSFTAVLAIATLGATWAAFCVANPVGSGLRALLIATVAAGVHFLFTAGLKAAFIWSVPTRYGFPLATAWIIWCGMRYCRAHGYRCVGSPAN